MAIAENHRPRAEQVLNDIYNSYAANTLYDLVNEPLPVGVTNTSFARSRKETISPLVTMQDWSSQHKFRDSFMSEWVVMLGLRKPLGQAGVKIELAPPTLEIGSKERKGVDLIASRPHQDANKNAPVFAVNVKLRRPKFNNKTERYKYDKLLGCPSIELSLGDFSIRTRKSGEVSFVPWLRQVATPNIAGSGQIPEFSKWQTYLIEKVAGTVSHYMIKTDDYIYGDYKPSSQEIDLFPQTSKEFGRFYENLSFTYMTFKKLSRTIESEMG